jgi:hypothetical protein
MLTNSFAAKLPGVQAALNRCRKIPAAGAALVALLVGSPAQLVQAQSVAQCQPTAPALYPPFVDTTSTTPGWDPGQTAAYAKTHLVLGDVDGDGEQEIVALNQGQIQLWHWIQTGWTPMVAFPSAQIAAHPPAHDRQSTAQQVALADLTGDGQKDIVVYVAWTATGLSPIFQEQVYHYNLYIDTWTLLVQDQVTAPSYWFKAHSTDVIDSRLRGWAAGAFQGLNVQQFNKNGGWNEVSVGATPQLSSLGFHSQCTQTGGACIGLYDVTGDGIVDLIALGDNGMTYIVPSTTHRLFEGNQTESKIPQVTVENGVVNGTTVQGWQLNQGLLIVPNFSVQQDFNVVFSLAAYHWMTSDFQAVSDPNQELTSSPSNDGAFPYTLTVLPNATSTNAQIVFVGQSGVYDFPLTASATGPLTVGTPQLITADISSMQGFAEPGYSGYFQIATEGNTVAMIARSPQGIVTRVPSSTATPSQFVNPETLTDRGYPKFKGGQLLAYEYIGANSAGNPDLRSLYADPAVSWANIQTQIETLAAPPAAAGITQTDFQVAQKQILAEVAALQSVNLLFAATGTILTNTYLVKDASLSEITDVLNLPAQPDVAEAVINDITTALNGLGAAAEGAGAVFSALKDIAAALNNSGSVLELLGTITGDVATYTTSNPIATNSYDLKTQLDNSALGAVTANACHQASTLTSWSQSKPIADGLLTGELPLDLDTQQIILEATQSLFQLTVWQALVPAKWDYVAVAPPGCFDFACTFTGNAKYPESDAVQANCNGSNGSDSPVSLVLYDTSNNNYPNLFALNALFNAPPLGLGASPSDVMFGKNGWSLTFTPYDILLSANTLLNTFNCKTITPAIIVDAVPAATATAAVTANEASAMKAASTIAPAASSPASSSATLSTAIKSLTTLSKQVSAAHSENAGFGQRMVMYLSVAISRLKNNQLLNQQPSDAIQLLNTFIAQSQWHATLKQSDSKASNTEAIGAVSVRDSLLALTAN